VKKKFFLTFIGVVVLLILGSLLFREKLPVSTPEAADVVWQECLLTEGYGNWRQAQECFGLPEPTGEREDGINYSKRVGMENFQLNIGEDVYQTHRMGSFFSFEVYSLSRNQWPISIQLGEFIAHSPNIGLDDVAGKAAWEFVTLDKPTIIYNERNLRQRYNLDQAFSPYSLNGKLVFLGQQTDRFFVVFDGKRLSPDYEDVIHAYCCEAVMYSPVGRQGAYLFNARRNGMSYLVMLTSSKK
jgi:hypothetical protein